MESLKKQYNEFSVQLRNINDQCSTFASNINKNLETLAIYKEYKDFLDKLSQSDSAHEESKNKPKKKED